MLCALCVACSVLCVVWCGVWCVECGMWSVVCLVVCVCVCMCVCLCVCVLLCEQHAFFLYKKLVSQATNYQTLLFLLVKFKIVYDYKVQIIRLSCFCLQSLKLYTITKCFERV